MMNLTELNRTHGVQASEEHFWDAQIHEEPIHTLMPSVFPVFNVKRQYDELRIAAALDCLVGRNKDPREVLWHHVDPFFEWFNVERSGRIDSRPTEHMRQRLANANDYFRRKASEVFNDKAALDLLEVMHRDVVVDISDLDICEHGLSLAKLTAANFCEIGAKVVYITEAGQRFMNSLRAQEIS